MGLAGSSAPRACGLLWAPILGLSLATAAGCQGSGNGAGEKDEPSQGADEDDSEEETEEKGDDSEDGSKKKKKKKDSGSSKKKKKKKKKKDEPKEEEEEEEDDSEEESNSSSSSTGEGEDSSEPGDDSSDEPEDSTKDEKPGDGTGYPDNDRDCDKVAWGRKKGSLNVGAALPRQEVQGYFDSDGDNKVETDKLTTVGTCAMHMTGRKCGIIVVGRKG